VGRQVGAAGAEGRQVPAHGGDVVEHALAEERLPPSDRPLEAEHRPLPAQCQVLRAVPRVLDGAADEPDAIAAPELGHDDPAGEELPPPPAALPPWRPAEQSELLAQAEAGAVAQEGRQRAA